MADTEHRSGESAEERGYESSDVNLGAIVFFGLLLFGGTAASFFVTWLCFKLVAFQAKQSDRPLPPMAAKKDSGPPQPHLLIDEPKYVTEVREGEAEVLDGYAWVDKQAGVVRIPIERALDLVEKEGLPARSTAGRGEGEKP